jgi:hypothetical protein
MELFVTILKATAPVFILLFIGACLRKFEWLTNEAENCIMKMMVSIFYPCLIFISILDNSTLAQGNNLIMAPLIGAGTILLSLFTIYQLAPLFRINENNERRTFAFTSGIYNYGYIPVPILQAIFPASGIVGVLMVHNLGVEAMLWTVGLMTLTGSVGRSALKKLITPPIVVLILGLLINLSGLHNYLISPTSNTFVESLYSILIQVIRMLSKCSIPIGLIMCGAALYQAGKGKRIRQKANVSLAACFCRLFILPILFLLIARFAPISMDLKRVIVVQAAMPAALFPLVLTKFYGGDTQVGVRAILSTTILSFLTIPLWVTLGLSFI